jgi:misacylated tRNA(Ala) deacylase
MTENLFADDAYLKSCEAAVTAVDGNAVTLDRTVFYAMSGGQLGDTGRLIGANGAPVQVADTRKGDGGAILHVLADGAVAPAAGSTVTAEIDWERRHRLMRMHTCLHLLSAVLPYPVTGGQVSDGKGRLDFDIPEAILEKNHITGELNRLIREDHAVTTEWITDDDLATQPDLVKTMSVKPPSGLGRVRLLRVGDAVDVQPCGGTHVRSTAEIGEVRARKIEKKGRQNRRVSLEFV